MNLVKRFGQALHKNRPHLVGNGCLTPLIARTEFETRRSNLLRLMKPNSLAIFGGNRIQYASPSVFYPFRQDPNFQYLTGFLEPESCLLLHKDVNDKGEAILLVPEKNEFAEKWEGERTGIEGAKQEFGFENVISNEKLRETVQNLISKVSKVYADIDPKTTMRQTSFYSHELPKMVFSKLDLQSASTLCMQLRIIKSESELDCLRIAGEISSEVYNMAMTQEFKSETQLQSYLSFMFRNNGLEDDSYYPVVAGGDHALTIHYVRNDDLLKNEDLVLVDAAGRYGGYCADISRTWPVGGKLSEAQKDIYEVVLDTNKQCITKCTVKSGMSLYDLHSFSEQVMKQNLANIGLDMTMNELRTIYPHMIGHQLGLDVHDIDISDASSSEFVSNQVITVEPGLYFPHDSRFPKRFRGIGIRIEDDIVVGEDMPENLTEACWKEVADVQR
ncbi:aminopeptidase [Starmerella bacillaris]|mgnify:CR=1 FL=1|uniref:Aminopeptidase n=1 Tax=Starmerella bacillaris TaxID=1247836 RepID=A0AAV5RCL1_STABA|nr:aminopeptidase [Starmerella bacillaris]